MGTYHYEVTKEEKDGITTYDIEINQFSILQLQEAMNKFNEEDMVTVGSYTTKLRFRMYDVEKPKE